MTVFKASWQEKVNYTADIEAEDELEAIEKVKVRDYVEGTVDTHITDSKVTKIWVEEQ